jgi:hypothetical protein
MFLFLIIEIGLLSLSVSTIMTTNAQASSGSTPGGISSGSSGSGTGDSGSEGNNGKDQKQKDNTDKQMGICVVGVESPCNSDSNLDRHG